MEITITPRDPRGNIIKEVVFEVDGNPGSWTKDGVTLTIDEHGQPSISADVENQDDEKK